MGTFDQFANQGGPAAWDPEQTAEAQRVAEEQLRNADYAGEFPEPLGNAGDAPKPQAADDEELEFEEPDIRSPEVPEMGEEPETVAEPTSRIGSEPRVEPDAAVEFRSHADDEHGRDRS